MTDQVKATEKKQAATEDIKNESKNIFFVFDAWRSMDTASVRKMKIEYLPWKDMCP
jgi:hypothetical protein